jgi:hypothetical protein
MVWRASPVAPSRVASGSAASHWAYSRCKAISSATASRQRCGRLRRSVCRRLRIAAVPVWRADSDEVARDYEMMSPGFGASLACILFALGRCRSSVLDSG